MRAIPHLPVAVLLGVKEELVALQPYWKEIEELPPWVLCNVRVFSYVQKYLTDNPAVFKFLLVTQNCEKNV